MNTSIHKSDRSYKYHQKGLRNGEVKKTKSQALKDITDECGEGKLYKHNYIASEHLIMRYLKDRINFDFII